jgi:hypothetical protein
MLPNHGLHDIIAAGVEVSRGGEIDGSPSGHSRERTGMG